MDLWVDRTKAQEGGLNTQAIAQNVLISLGGSFQTSPTYWLDPKNRVSYQVSTQTPHYRVCKLPAFAYMPITRPIPNSPASLLPRFSSGHPRTRGPVGSHHHLHTAMHTFGGFQRPV